MSNKNYLMSGPVNRTSLTKCMLTGGGIALVFILFFILRVDEPRPEWPKLWMLRPLIITPFMGIFGGAVYLTVPDGKE